MRHWRRAQQPQEFSQFRLGGRGLHSRGRLSLVLSQCQLLKNKREWKGCEERETCLLGLLGLLDLFPNHPLSLTPSLFILFPLFPLVPLHGHPGHDSALAGPAPAPLAPTTLSPGPGSGQ
ncbi:hypothetical protein THARTR1_00037 [Trichoderma harzianum]|uniref:Uncharacterized protein n=1 Tax=Trichoderma harzianum TaxID=5544 RepID=A0A2K0UQG7_TRIHA|nr:hypothetical protein THARTR1_00037 [Trichoderma harzianum]